MREIDTNLETIEINILTLIAHGLNNNEIAEQLNVSGHTVKAHMASIYRKLCAKNRAHAVYMATKTNIL